MGDTTGSEAPVIYARCCAKKLSYNPNEIEIMRIWLGCNALISNLSDSDRSDASKIGSKLGGLQYSNYFYGSKMI